MKLLRLYLENYRVLRDLDIMFDDVTQRNSRSLAESDSLEARGVVFSRGTGESYALDFLVGVNGSGKSTVLHALVEIFRRLETQPDGIELPFLFEYELMIDGVQRHIRIENRLVDPQIQTRKGFLVLVDDKERLFGNDLLPDRIIIFTTGDEREWIQQDRPSDLEGNAVDVLQNIDKNPLLLALHELPGRPITLETAEEVEEGEGAAHRDRILFVRSQYLPHLILCGLLSNIASQKKIALSCTQ